MRVNCVSAEFRKVSDIQMAETTKRTIRENISINQQLVKMSEKSLSLIEENKKLKKAEKQLKISLEILGDTNTFVTRKNFSREKVLSMLRSKAMELETWSSQLEERLEQCADLKNDAYHATREAADKSREIEVGQF